MESQDNQVKSSESTSSSGFSSSASASCEGGNTEGAAAGEVEVDTLTENDIEEEGVEVYDPNSSSNTLDEPSASLIKPYMNVDLETLLGMIKVDVPTKPKSDNDTESDDKQDQLSNQWTLDTVPVEIFLKICSFLEAGNLIRTVSLVCKRFHCILSNETTWRIRQTQRWYKNGIYPPVPVNEDEFIWSQACIKREEQISLWGNNGMNLRNVELSSHIGCVDAVHLFNNGEFLASGSRDRSINIYNVEKCFDPVGEPPYETVPGLISRKDGVHQGWIWSFATNPSYLLSGSWDNSLKCFDRKSNFELVSEYKTRSPCLCLSAMENLIAAGTFDKKVLLFDPRVNANAEPISQYVQHKRSVLALGMDENNIISCGEDGRIIKYDLRGGKVEKIIALKHPAYSTCLSFRREDPASLFYVGDKLGNLYLIDFKKFKIIKKYPALHTRAIQGVYHGLGSVLTCSSDGLLKVFEPSSGLNEVSSIHIQAELPDVHSLNNIVALAGGEGIVRLYSPVSNFYN